MQTEVRPNTTSDEAVKKATGKDWQEWFDLLDREGARDMAHKDIAALLHSKGYITQGWWAQSITVAYEQKTGRREPGQSCAGDYQVSASVTVPGSMDEALARWSERFGEQTEFSGVRIAAPPAATERPNWRYWRVKLEDGTRVSVNFSEKAGGKTSVHLQHEKLTDQAAINRWRQYWKGLLAEEFRD